MDIDRKQRTDIDKVQDDRISLAIDELTLQQSSYSYPLTNFSGTNWLNENETFVKYNIVEEDNIKFIVEPITQLAQKDVLNIKLSLDYEIDEGSIIINNVFLIHNDLMDYKIVENEIKGIGHIDIECQIFDINPKLLNTVITEQGFDIGIGINGNKSNSTVKFSNVQLVFEFDNKLSDETDAVVNRLIPEIDFWREGNKLYLQVGDVSESHGSHGGGGTNIDTYTKDEIDNLLNRKVNVEIGKTLSSNDYTSIEKRKLEGIEENANYYAHPSIHETNMIIESSPLSSVGTGEEATQHEINLNIDNSLGNKANSEDIPISISDLVNDSDFIEKSNTPGLVKNDGSIDSTTYLSSLPLHNHDDRYYTESEVDTALNNKQATLVSGSNIKTINNTSLLGSGNISIQGGGTVIVDDSLSTTSTNPVQNKVVTGALNGKANSSHTHLSSDVTDLIDVIYPVGSIYMSVNSVNPSTLFGGTWEQIENKFLLASGNNYELGTTGGEATHTLTTDEMPSHTHIQDSHNHTQNSHNHTQNSHNHTQNAHHHALTGSKSVGLQEGSRLRVGYGSTSDSKNTNNTTATNNAATATNKATTATNNAATATNQNTGGGEAHNNMPPYLVVNVWKRTA